MRPKVSVIIPVYNCEKYISETVESVLNQTYSNYEIIVVDDGSTDGTKEVLSKFGSKIKYVLKENGGVSAARNKGISIAEGEFIALLDHDDLWTHDKLEKQMKVFEENPGLGLVYSDMYVVDEDGNILENYFKRVKPFRNNVFKELFVDNFIPCLTVVIPKKVFDDVGLFLPDYAIAEEYDVFLRIVREYRVDFISEPLAKYRLHDANFSRNVKTALWESLSITNRLLKDNPDAEKVLGKRMINRKYYLIHYRMAKACFSEGEDVECRKHLKKAIRLRWYSPSCYILYPLTFCGRLIMKVVVILKKLINSIMLRSKLKYK